MSEPGRETRNPGRPPWRGELREVLERYQGVLLFEGLLGIFEIVLYGFGWINAVLAVVLVPGSLAAYFGGVWALRRVGGRSVRLRFGMRHLMVFVCMAAVFFQLVKMMGWSLVWLVGMALPPFVVLGGWLFLRSRGSTQQEGMISVMGMAAKRGLPLGPAVRAYAGLCKGVYRRRAVDLAERMEGGLTLPEALDAVPGVLPADVAALARAGWDSNLLGAALERASEARRAEKRDAPTVRSIFAYPLFVLGFVMMGVGFLANFVLPKMQVITRDFGVAMPGATLVSIQILDVAMVILGLPFVAVFSVCEGLLRGSMSFDSVFVMFAAMVAVFGVIGGFVMICWWMVMGMNRALGHVVGNRFEGHLPRRRWWWVRRSFSRDCSAVLRSLALGVESGLPMVEVLDRLAGSELGTRVRMGVRWVEADLRAGRPWIASLARRHLIRPVDAAVLRTAERVGNLAWCLRERADALDRRRSLRLRALAVVLQPVAAIALGGLVLVAALTYFLPLVAMIQAMVDAV